MHAATRKPQHPRSRSHSTPRRCPPAAAGTMDVKEVSRALEAMGLDLSRQEAKKVLMQVDKDGSGALSFSEFRTLMHSACGGLRGLPSLRKNLQRLKTGLV